MTTEAKTLTASRTDTRRLATMAMLVALGYIVTVVTRFPLIAAAPYLKYDPKSVVLVIGGFLYGPLAGGAMCLAAALIEMFTVGQSGIWGFIMNVLASVAFVCPAAWCYRRRRTLKSAVAGLTAGVVILTVTMLVWNYLITPLYNPNMTREAVAGLLLPVILPFNLLKGGLNMALTLLLYQPVNNGLRRLHLLPALPDGEVRRKIHVGNVLFGAALLAVCLFAVQVMLGKI